MSRADARGRETGVRGRLVWAAQFFAVLCFGWMLLNGRDGWAFGLIAAALGAAAAAWLAPGPPERWNPFRLLRFAAFFLVESIRAGGDVALRTLAPRMPIAPQFFDYRIRLPEGQPRTLLVSTITLLPGTLSAELSADETILVVHELSPGGREAVARLEARIAWLFSLEHWSGAAPR